MIWSCQSCARNFTFVHCSFVQKICTGSIDSPKITIPNREGVAEPHFKIWTDGRTDRQGHLRSNSETKKWREGHFRHCHPQSKEN